MNKSMNFIVGSVLLLTSGLVQARRITITNNTQYAVDVVVVSRHQVFPHSDGVALAANQTSTLDTRYDLIGTIIVNDAQRYHLSKDRADLKGGQLLNPKDSITVFTIGLNGNAFTVSGSEQ